ncbi:MAG TPA: hypothetical protein VEB40_08215 [Flavipsychrobacter sp.]|nr:hypothetical protein [Flavipsychrobacter sp.]
MREEGISRQQYNGLVAAFFFGVAAVAIGLLAILYSYKQILDLRKEKARLQASVSMLKSELDNKGVRKEIPVNDIKEETNTHHREAASSSTAKKPAKSTVMEKKTPVAKEPAKKKDTKAAIPKVSSREVVITYYHRKADNVYLVATLQSLGYRFEGKTLDENTGNERTNCVWYGAGVPVSDVKKVATALIRSGTTIKGIQRFGPSYKNPSYKRNIIEIGREEKYEKSGTKGMAIYDVESAKL